MPSQTSHFKHLFWHLAPFHLYLCSTILLTAVLLGQLGLLEVSQ